MAGGGFKMRSVQYIVLCVLPIYVVRCDETIGFIGGWPEDLQYSGSCWFYNGWWQTFWFGL